MMVKGFEVMTDKDLDALLVQAANAPRLVSIDLLGWVLDDAYSLQPAAPVATAPIAARTNAAPQLSWRYAGLGWAAGLAAVALGGVWIGFSEPVGLSSVAENLWAGSSAESVELMPDLDTFMTEG